MPEQPEQALSQSPWMAACLKAILMAISTIAILISIKGLPSARYVQALNAIQSSLTRGETINELYLAGQHAREENYRISACDTDAQTTLALMELQLAEKRLASGLDAGIDDYLSRATGRSISLLRCAPNRSFPWFFLFWTRFVAGDLDVRRWEILAESYKLGPNESWISLRRLPVLVRIWPFSPDMLTDYIINDFRVLAYSGFWAEDANAYLFASRELREILVREVVLKLDTNAKARFNDLIVKLGMDGLVGKDDLDWLKKIGPVQVR